MMDIQILKDFVKIFAIASVVLLVLHRIRIPVLVGFLFTGVILGPYGLGLIRGVHEVETLAEIGVILLLFTIGIEFSLKNLLRIKRAIFLGGSAQVLLTIFFSAAIVFLIRFPLNEAIFFGFLISLSSTAIVLKVLQGRGEIESPHGQTSLAILIYQDLVIVPMILLTPILAGATANVTTSIATLALKLIGVILLTWVLSRWIVHGILYQVVKTGARELFIMAVLVICFAVAWLTSSLGLSLAMGAFLAGLIVSESEYSTHAFSHIVPFRDLFTSFFFISIGMLFELNFLLASAPLILLIVISVMLLKSVIAGFVGTLIGLSFKSAMIVGFSLSQIGEFSFVLSRFGLNEGLISTNIYQLFLASSILSMACTPFIITVSPRLADFLSKLPLPKRIKTGFLPIAETIAEKMQDHLIIVGFGVNGKNIARAAKLAGIPYSIIEMNPVTVHAERKGGEPIFFGDASKEHILKHTSVETAKAMVVAIPDAEATVRIVELTRQLNPNLHLIIRTRLLKEVERLYNSGANEVIPEEFETSIAIFRRVLERFSVSPDQIEKYITELRSECYRKFYDFQQDAVLDAEVRQDEIQK